MATVSYGAAWRYACLAFLCIFASSSAEAGAWTLPKGESKWMFASEYTFAARMYDGNGKVIQAPYFRRLRDSLYGEFGLTDRLTVVGELAYESRSIGSSIFSYFSGLGYSEFGGRVRLWEGYNAVFSAQGTARIAGAGDEKNPVEYGHTETEADVRMLIGYSFSLFQRHMFTDVQGAYRMRFGAPADEVRIDATAGIQITRRLKLLAQSFNTLSVGQVQKGWVSTEDHKIQMSGVWEITPRWSMQFGSRSTIAGKNTWQEQTVFGAVWTKF